jgi:hypothetical protein
MAALRTLLIALSGVAALQVGLRTPFGAVSLPVGRTAFSALRMQAGDAMAAAPATVPAAYIEFMVGVPEPVVPDVKLTRSRDGSTGVATFTFDGPSFLSAASADLGETTGERSSAAESHLCVAQPGECATCIRAVRVSPHLVLTPAPAPLCGARCSGIACCVCTGPLLIVSHPSPLPKACT